MILLINSSDINKFYSRFFKSNAICHELSESSTVCCGFYMNNNKCYGFPENYDGLCEFVTALLA